MAKLQLYSIIKREKSPFDPLYDNYIKMISKYVDVTVEDIFNKNIAKAQQSSEEKAKKEYTSAYEKKLTNSFNIALDVEGKELDSYGFSQLLQDRAEINFFIGGAYGFEKQFLNRCDRVISLGKITMAHKVAKMVLLEQIFRGYCIANNHPYHKE
ncbi:MAG: 23S rRNA (pseudouridine(1915)-N(3))-methyltransferase RlmH [Campylobacterota bacterium]